MEDKEKLQNSILGKMKGVLDGNQFLQLKQVLCTEMYDYNVEKIKNTEIVEYEGTKTQQLLEYFVVGKLSSNQTKETVNQYVRVVNQLCGFIGKELDEITKEDIRLFLIKYKMQHNISDVTMDCKRRYLSSVFSYLFKNEMISKNPMMSIDPISYKKVVKQPLKDDEIKRLELSCTDKRNSAIMTFFLETGVRVSELCNIKICDVDFVNRKCKVLGKENKERIVFFTGKSYVLLMEYLRTRKDIDTSKLLYSSDINVPLFASKKKPYNKLQKGAVEKIIRDLRKPSGVPRVHCHLFRATYATDLSLKGVSLELIAKLLGHANLDCLDRYVLNGEDKIEAELKRVGSVA